LQLIEYTNFEAGEGKSALDTHFAHVSHKITRWVRVGNNLETGEQLADLVKVQHGCVFLILKIIVCFALPCFKFDPNLATVNTD